MSYNEHLEQAQIDAVRVICDKAKLTEQCESCSIELDLGNDRDSGYSLANKLITDKDPLVSCFSGDRKALAERITEFMDNLESSCSYCDADNK